MGKLLSIIISNSHMRIAELSPGRNGVAVYRLLTKDVPGSLVSDGAVQDVRGMADFLVATLRNANIRTKKVVFSLSSDKIMSREVILPELPEEKLKIALKANASEYFPIDLSDYVLAYFPISKIVKNGDETLEEDESEEGAKSRKKKAKKTKGKKRIETQLRLMVVAAPNEMVQSYYDLARLAHLQLQAVDYIGNSVFQLTADQIGEEPCLVLQLDEERTVLTVYHENVMILQRHVDFGSSAVVQAVMDEKGLDYHGAEEELAEQELIRDNFDEGDAVTESLYYLIGNIKRIIEYYTGRNADHPLESVYVMGDGSAMRGLDRLLETQLYLPAETITTLRSVIVKEDKGLAMGEVLRYMDNIGAVIDPVNLLPKQLEQDIRRKLEAKAYRVMILLALFAAAVIVTVPATKYFSVAMDALDLQNKLLLMEDVKPILNNYNQASARYGDVQQVQTLVRTDNESLLYFINVFEQLRPSNVSLDNFSCGEGQIGFSAIADSKKTVVKLIQQLNMIANVSDVQVSGLSSVFLDGQETVSFSVTCQISNTDQMLNGTAGDAQDGAMDLTPEEKAALFDEVNEKTMDVYEALNGSRPYEEDGSGASGGAGSADGGSGRSDSPDGGAAGQEPADGLSEGAE